MAKWQVIPVEQRERQFCDGNLIWLNYTVVAPHHVTVEAYNNDGTLKEYYSIKSIDNKVLTTTKPIPQNTLFRVKYYTVIKLEKIRKMVAKVKEQDNV